MPPNGFPFTFTMLKFLLMLKTDYIWKTRRSNKVGPTSPCSTNWLGSTVAMTYGGTEAPGHFRDQPLPDCRCKFTALGKDAWWPHVSQVSPVKSPEAITIFVTKAPQTAGLGWWQHDNSLWGLCSFPYFPSYSPSPWVHVQCCRHCIN